MKFNGNNIEEVMELHYKWVKSAGEMGEEGRADFSGCDLSHSDFGGANFYGANFRGANLSGCNLFQTDFRCADLTGANLFACCLQNCNMEGAINPPYIPMDIPDTGSFIGWKRVKDHVPEMGEDHYDHSIIAKLLIPEDADRIRTMTGECRASKVVVLELQTMDGEKLPDDTVGYSIKDRGETQYRVGETVCCSKPFSFNRYQHFVPGIYFYMERPRAVDYLTFGRLEGKPIIIDAKEAFERLESANHW